MNFLQHLLRAVVSGLFMGLAGTFIQTWFVLEDLERIGAPITAGTRLDMHLDDLVGFGPAYAGLSTFGFLIAFAAADLVKRKVSLSRYLVFPVAGAACLALMLFLMETVFFGTPVIAGARHFTGTAVQIGLGAFAGLIGAILTKSRR